MLMTSPFQCFDECVKSAVDPYAGRQTALFVISVEIASVGESFSSLFWRAIAAGSSREYDCHAQQRRNFVELIKASEGYCGLVL